MIKLNTNEYTFWAANVAHIREFEHFKRHINCDTKEEWDLVEKIFSASFQYRIDLMDMVKDGVCLTCGADWTKPKNERGFVEFGKVESTDD